jgi:hypothetical protein
MRRGGKSCRHPNPWGSCEIIFAKTGVFAANRLDVGHSQLFKRDDQSVLG